MKKPTVAFFMRRDVSNLRHLLFLFLRSKKGEKDVFLVKKELFEVVQYAEKKP